MENNSFKLSEPGFRHAEITHFGLFLHLKMNIYEFRLYPPLQHTYEGIEVHPGGVHTNCLIIVKQLQDMKCTLSIASSCLFLKESY